MLLDAQVTEVSGGLLLNWDVRVPAFPDGVAEAMFDAYTSAITRLGAPDADWSAPLGIGAPASQLRVRHALNATPAPPPRTLTEGFFDQARRRPDAPALHWGDDGTLTYGELASRALRIASELVADGVRPGDRVSIELPKARARPSRPWACWPPVPPTFPSAPSSRRRADRRSARVLGCRVAHRGGDAEPLPEPVAVRPDQVAYVLFTSGSTGEPKGVEVSHGAAMNTIGDLVERFAIGEDDVTFGVSALDFDLSVFDLFAPWTVGGAVVLPDEDERRDAARWAELVRRWSVTVLNCVPSVLEMLLHADARRACGSSCWAATGWARTCPRCWRSARPAAGSWRSAGRRRRRSTRRCRRSRARCRPTGTPSRTGCRCCGVACRVVDELGRDRPDWVTGELWIGGAGVADGYVGDPARTADRFVVHEGVRWYRTGDLARYRPDGTLEFLGRRDHQVKVRGFRIELGEVEAALQEHPAVGRAVALLADGRLAAAVVASGDLDAVLAHARDLLPPHMVPELLVRVDELPLTANGKVDRKALTALAAAEKGEASYAAPETPLERVLARIVAEVLGKERVGADADFFALGGDSVLATTVIARLRRRSTRPRCRSGCCSPSGPSRASAAASPSWTRRRDGWRPSPRSGWRSRR